jgi:ribosomal protein S18 acetylase RimI-like enzyme
VVVRHPYQDQPDLERMRHLLVEGRRLSLGPYYVHVGDLNWWLYYFLRDLDWSEIIRLWERDRDGLLLAWALFSPAYPAFDVFVHPTECSGMMRAEIVAWAAAYAETAVRRAGGRNLQTVWVAEADLQLIEILEGLGFQRAEGSLFQLERPLGSLLAPEVPTGYEIRTVAGEYEAEERARASHEAFESPRPFDDYLQNYTEFMRSPAYEVALDLVAVSQSGEIASFCIAWPDPASGMGLLEPVGTRPAYQKLGLGRATILEALRRLRALGMESAMVCVEDENRAAQRLYASLGFTPASELRTYARDVTGAGHGL